MLTSSFWKSPASYRIDFIILSERSRETKQVVAASLISLFWVFSDDKSSSKIFLLSISFFLQLSSSLVNDARVLSIKCFRVYYNVVFSDVPFISTSNASDNILDVCS